MGIGWSCCPCGSEKNDDQYRYRHISTTPDIQSTQPNRRFSEFLADELWDLEPHEFNSWYRNTILNGTGDFKDDCGQIVDQVVQVMYQCMPSDVKVKKVIKGGSLGKGTMVKGMSDIDCVVFPHPGALPYLQDVNDVQDYADCQLADVINAMEYAIYNNCDNVVAIKKKNRFMLSVDFSINGRIVNVDMLPTAENLEQEGTPQIYESMLYRRAYDREFYSASLVTLQREFIKQKPGVVKELIRLVKYWNAYCVKSELEGTWPLPTSYPMELITIYAWEKAGSPYAFDLLQGFNAVMVIIAEDLRSIFCYWTDNYCKKIVYKAKDRMDRQSKRRPFILDPANPFNNVCARFHDTWPDVARVAQETLESNLLRSIYSNEDWQILNSQRFIRSQTKRIFSLIAFTYISGLLFLVKEAEPFASPRMGNIWSCACCPCGSKKKGNQYPPPNQRIFFYNSATPPYVQFTQPNRQFSKFLHDEPWNLQPHKFDSWYRKTILNGMGNFRDDCEQVLDQVVEVMQLYMPSDVKVKKVIKGGSLGKGTMVKGMSDIDCVVFMQPDALPYLDSVSVSEFQDYVNRKLAYVINAIADTITKHCNNVVLIKKDDFMLSVDVFIDYMEVKVDIIPTADNLEQEGTPQIYESMLYRRTDDREFYSASLVTLQKEFIKQKPDLVKELIRLVKYWNVDCVKSVLEAQWSGNKLPTSYPMELITIHAWEKAGRPERFNRLQGFKAVMVIIAEDLGSIYRYWPDNYCKKMVDKAISRMDHQSQKKPFILDPANPFNNVCARFHDTWPDVSRVARETLESNLLRSIYSNEDWQNLNQIRMGNNWSCFCCPCGSEKKGNHYPPPNQRVFSHQDRRFNEETPHESMSQTDSDDNSDIDVDSTESISWSSQVIPPDVKFTQPNRQNEEFVEHHDEPWDIQPHEFNNWYHNTIRNGTGDFKNDCGQIVDQVVQVMYRCMPSYVKVTKVIKGGSLGKGTMVNGLSDIDCVVFLDSDALPNLEDVGDVQDYAGRNLAYIIDTMKKTITNNCDNLVAISKNRFMLHVDLSISGRTVKVDMLSTADNLEQEGTPQIYESMLDRGTANREFYSAGLVTLQKEFIKQKPGAVKELIRLVKYWNVHCVKSALEETWSGNKLPTSYPMELITIHAWEKAGSPYGFELLQGFNAVMVIIAKDLRSIFRYWTDNYCKKMVYKARDRMDRQSKMRPFILDPANPFNNVCARFHDTWPDVARVAQETLESNLLRSIYSNEDWQS
ncbi:2'-5'-oligoadenylate synthase 3-like [Amphiura filiformis]|uniref:2'-5'-oligoadenylate synthase 3-like n=1 Tax=Amphiura filiformis TaxID=82378 RepID=UPI003B21EE6B